MAGERGARLLESLTRRGFRDGVLGGSRVWTYLGVTALLVRAGRAALRNRAEPVYRVRLDAGDAIEVRTMSARSRRARRRRSY
jgi:hypothetical protein